MSRLSQAALIAASAVAILLLGGIMLGEIGIGGSTDQVSPCCGTAPAPSATPPAPSSTATPRPTATLSAPTFVESGRDVPVSGSVTGLSASRSALWLTGESTGSGMVYVVGAGPVALSDGAWSQADPQASDPTDIGGAINYVLYLADPSCDDYFLSLPRNPTDGVIYLHVPPATCAPLRVVQVQIR